VPNVVFDASSIVGAALKEASIPERALLLARSQETICLSPAVETEIREVLQRPKFHKYISDATRGRILEFLGAAALVFESRDQVTDWRDPKDNKYLELALAAGASVIVSSDDDLLVLDPLAGHSDPATGRLRPIAGTDRLTRAQPHRSYSSGMPALRNPAR
jgi:putative PIN family toxin of toxin-antitoxin system